MNTYKKGLALVLIAALIGGFANWSNNFAVKGFNPYVFTTIKNITVALILTSILITIKQYKRLLKINKKNWLKLIFIGLIGGGIPFLLFFSGLKISTGVNAAFIHKTMFLYVGPISAVFLKERITKKQLMCIIGLLFGVYLLFNANLLELNHGDLLIFIATLFWSAEIIISKHALKELPASIVAWARMTLGSIFLLIYLQSNNLLINVINFSINQWTWITISSTFLLFYVITFYKGLKILKAVEAASILLIGSVITSLLSLLIGKALQVTQLIGLITIPIMIYLMDEKIHMVFHWKLRGVRRRRKYQNI